MDGDCSVIGCGKPVLARGWCAAHYGRWMRTGSVGSVETRTRRLGATCRVDGCSQRVKAYGWCVKHYRRVQAHGTPTPARPTRQERFWAKVAKSDGCWLWTGARTHYGYGRFERSIASRVAYELAVGPIPDGLTIDHLCFTPSCVRPDHLEAVTFAENRRRVRPKSHCPQGHPYEGDNVIRRANGNRVCRECNRIRRR